MSNQEQDINMEQLIKDQQAANFEDNMQRFNFVGRLTGWRSKMTNNSRRMDIVRGNMKINALLSRFSA